MPHPLQICRLKIGRAHEHRDALEAHCAETFSVEGNRVQLAMKYDQVTGEQIQFVSKMPDLTAFLARCSIVIGDCVHNLRSTLDHLSYQLAVLNTGDNIQNPDHIQFPICDSEERFISAKWRYKEIFPAHVAIIESSQKYKGMLEPASVGEPFHPLSMLRDLNNRNKHKLAVNLVLPMNWQRAKRPYEVFFMSGVGMVQQAFGIVAPTKLPFAALGAELMRAKLPEDWIKSDAEASYVTPKLAFDGGQLVIELSIRSQPWSTLSSASSSRYSKNSCRSRGLTYGAANAGRTNTSY